MKTFSSVLTFMLVLASLMRAQSPGSNALRALLEFRDDAVHHRSAQRHDIFARDFIFIAKNFFATQINVDSLSRNIVGDAANESRHW